VTFDTPVNERDDADVESVRRALEAVADQIPRGCIVLISSQVPAGFTRELARAWERKHGRAPTSRELLHIAAKTVVVANDNFAVSGFRRLENAVDATFRK